LIFLIRIALRVAVLLAILIAAYIFVPAIGTVSAQALHHSVSGVVGGSYAAGPRSCHAPHGTTHRCDVLAASGSYPTRYTVRLDGRCWTARRSATDHSLPARAHGCVKLRDQLRLLDRVIN
jgi:hypothetical protein